jgi:hypothetical protein
MKDGAQLIAEERERQISQEGYHARIDDQYTERDLAYGAAAYLDFALGDAAEDAATMWLWDEDTFKPVPNNELRNLVKAGAMIAAEIDRLQRLKG